MDNKFRLIEFTQVGGAKLSIDPAKIVAIEHPESEAASCYLYVTGHQLVFEVQGTYSEVKERCLS